MLGTLVPVGYLAVLLEVDHVFGANDVLVLEDVEHVVDDHLAVDVMDGH